MKSTDLKGKNLGELDALLLNSKKELFNLRFQRTNRTLTNTARVKIVKKTVARIKTFINNLSSSVKGGNNA